MKFAKGVFYVAAVYGLFSLLPLYSMFDYIGRQDPPAITHPQFYYGFIGVALAWQIAFLVIATDPVRFRPLMAVSVVEKFGYVIAVTVLYAQNRMSTPQALTTLPDCVLGVLFILAFVRTPAKASA